MGRHPTRTYALVASLLSILVTLLGVLLTATLKPANSRYAIPVLYLLVCTTLIIIGFVYLYAYMADLRNLRREIAHYATLERLVPTYVVFKRRVDTLVVEPNGDAMLTWEFDLASNSRQHITQLTFSIYVELPPDRPPEPSVVVQAIEVNGQSRGTEGVYQLIEKRTPMDRPWEKHKAIEFGLLRVPVDLERGHEECNVKVIMRHYKVYSQPFQVVPMFVEIPYLTEQLRVTIRTKGFAVRRPPGAGQTITAMSSLMHTEDLEEATAQGALCMQHGTQLVWETDCPKLGYHYKIFFHLEKL